MFSYFKQKAFKLGYVAYETAYAEAMKKLLDVSSDRFVSASEYSEIFKTCLSETLLPVYLEHRWLLLFFKKSYVSGRECFKGTAQAKSHIYTAAVITSETSKEAYYG